SFLDLLTPYGLWTGLTLAMLCLFQGSVFLTLKTDGEIRLRSRRLATFFLGPAVAVVAVWGVWNVVEYSKDAAPVVLQIVACLGLLASWQLLRLDRDLYAMLGGVVTIAAVMSTVFVVLYPNVMVSSTDSAFNLTVANASSANYALTVMTVVAVT